MTPPKHIAEFLRDTLPRLQSLAEERAARARSLDAVGPVSLPRRVFVASPLRGDIPKNQAYARDALRDSLARGEAPFVPHLLYDQVLDDSVEEERQQAIDAALAMLAGCELLAVYEDLGVSEGMAGEIERARVLGIPIERRSIQ